MSTFGQRLRLLRGERSQQWLSGETGISRPGISMLETGEAKPERVAHEKMVRLVTALQTTPEYLLKGEGNQTVRVYTAGIRLEEEGESVVNPDTVSLTVYDVEVSAGSGRISPQYVETRRKLSFSREWMRAKGIKEENAKIVKVRGESMVPVLFDGDDVLIDISRTRVRDGHVFALIYGGEARVKRLFQMAGGKLRISSENPDKSRYPDELIEGEMLNEIQVLGQAMHRMGSGGM